MLVAIIEILASLGLFLFGMLYLEERIKTASGRSFKRMINNATRTNIRSLSLGFTATAVFQSSSVVSLMTLSLIGAGVLSLQNGIGIIFGSNIGTTVTSWIIALIGFKFDIQLIAYGVIALGGIGSIMVKSESIWKHYFGGMVGFGLIFLGLEGMKESFSFISKGFDLTDYKELDLYLFFFVGIILTAIVQSSSASIAIAQSALFTQLISFDMAAFFIIGANVGTTVTILLGSIGGSPDKKRAAAVHFLFNLSTAITALVLISPLTKLTFLIISVNEPIIALAMFHTIFNVLGVLLWFFW
ncbi:Na/Pi cotransporter family protein, partial [Campylobacterota bacterium]